MNRKELYDFAKTLNQEGASVGALIQAIDEAHHQLVFSSQRLSALAAGASKSAVGYGVEQALTSTVHDYNVAAAKLNTLFLTLAVVLEQQGHKVEY